MPEKSLFSSQLIVLREVFNTIHGSSLLEGKACRRTLVAELQRSGVKVPQEIIDFFAKISIYLKIRHLNNVIKIKKRKREIGKDREIARKKIKLNI